MKSLKASVLVLSTVLWPQLSAASTLDAPCDPDNDVPTRDGLICQATTDRPVKRDSYIQNARKGDIVLSAGCGMIGGLLRQLKVRQRYSHSGIMDTNYNSLIHSTAVESRYHDNVIGDVGGHLDIVGEGTHIDTNILKFGWPGIIRQTVHDAFNGEKMKDPDNPDKEYEVRAFNPNLEWCRGDEAIIFPWIVKPPVDLARRYGTQATLDRVADAAANIHGHYRFGRYTQAADSLEESVPQGLWPLLENPQRTEGTVCSQMIWMAANSVGAPLEDVEEEDGDRPHSSLGTGKRGLYFYPEEERLAAGKWLVNEFDNAVREKAGPFVRWISKAGTQIPNQVANCFAFDWCGDERAVDGNFAWESEAWMRPGDGVAVSPDDITNWDPPPKGSYGYGERLIYRQSEVQVPHRWARADGTGDLVVKVTRNGRSSAGAIVRVRGLNLEKTTDSSGVAHFLGVPAGLYSVEAYLDVIVGGTSNRLLKTDTAEVPNRDVGQLGINLKDMYRDQKVSLIGEIFMRDHEWKLWGLVGEDETKTIKLSPATYSTSLNLDGARRSHTFYFQDAKTFCVGGEVLLEGNVHIELQADGSVRADINTILHEGQSCEWRGDSPTEWNSKSMTVSVPSGSNAPIAIDLFNGEAKKDLAELRFQIINEAVLWGV